MARIAPKETALKRIEDAIRTNATQLYLRDLGLTTIPAQIGKLTNLTSLYVGHNLLTTLPAEIGNLTNLTSLDFFDNKLTSIPPEIGKLIKLKELDISHNLLTELPTEIGQLTNLTSLYIHENQITSLPPEIANLTNLTTLWLYDNQIAQLPIEIGKLTKLITIFPFGNQITALPAEIGQLTNLTSLYLQDNKLTSLPIELLLLKNLVDLDLNNNSLSIPPEILATHRPQTILNYYFSLLPRQETEKEITVKAIDAFGSAKPINQTKFIVVGQGSVGKTSLIQKIIHNTFNNNQVKTEGISICQWTASDQEKLENKNNEITLNIWDFGGQEIMHATHQFFLTKRSLYLLVLDARLTQEENRIEYWLKIIQSFGGESPVLIVGNKTDQHPLDIDRTGLSKKYQNIVGILETSAATGVGIEALKAEIAKQVDTLPHVRDLLPETWFIVKTKLEELAKNKNFFTQDEYLGLCNTNNVKDETSQRTLISFLHDLGVVLHFQDDPRLEVLGILNPQWVTNGVYKILNSHELFQNQGTLTLPLLNKILDFPEYPNTTKRLYIVDMMKKFELCYDIEPDKSFLIPDLLPKDEPFTGEWDGALAFQIHYNILPSSIISRFIVRMNAFIYKTIWRSGVILKHEKNDEINMALIKADTEDRKIYIWVNGKESTRRYFLSTIRMEFDAIHKTIAKIEATEKIPLQNAPDAPPVDYEFLLRLANEGRELLPVQAGSQIIDLIVKEVLSQIEIDSRKTEIHFHGNMEGSNLVVGDKNRLVNTKTKKK